MNHQDFCAVLEREIQAQEIIVSLAQKCFAMARQDEAAAQVLYRTGRLAQMNALWTRASAEAAGDVERARTLFEKYRAEQVAADRQLQHGGDNVLRLLYGAMGLVSGFLTIDYGWKFVLTVRDLHAPNALAHVIISLLAASVFGFATYACWWACIRK